LRIRRLIDAFDAQRRLGHFAPETARTPLDNIRASPTLTDNR
jgi:hypothetical protein